MRGLVVLGSTGTIGRNTLDVAARHADRVRVLGLSAHRDDEGLFAQCRAHDVRFAAMADAAAAHRLEQRAAEAGVELTVFAGGEGVQTLAQLDGADTVMAAIVGAAGLLPTLAAVRCGKRVLLATKEALVMSGALFMRAVAEHGAELIPIDSEHNALFQCLPAGTGCGQAPRGVRRLILTASGGPFRDWSAERLGRATPNEAVTHPNWTMGRKISVDSATMMNKGLELIEAAHLFAMPADSIEVVVHRQSIIHSLVEYVDGSMLAQLGAPDMRVPIAHALAAPERWESGADALSLTEIARLEFEAPDPARFPSLKLAREALEQGGGAPAALNAANEVAVDAFLADSLPFTGIADTVARTLDRLDLGTLPGDIDAVLAVDASARETARGFVEAAHA